MDNILNYLNDGADYQPQMILCYLRGHENDFATDCQLDGEDLYYTKNIIEVGRFENCREQGYVFGLTIRNFRISNDKWMVVENSNSDDVTNCDSIKIRHFKVFTTKTPTDDIAYDDRYLIEEKLFQSEDIINAARYILNGMRQCVDEYIESKEFQTIKKVHNEKFGKK